VDDEIVWLKEYRTYAVLVSRHAYYSVVKREIKGHTIELEVLNDDYDYWEGHTFDSDDDGGY
jgi:hypothetical protein